MYHYRVTEQNDGLEGYTYDAASFDVTVTVTRDADDKLVATVEGADSIQFTNTYTAPLADPDDPNNGNNGEGDGNGNGGTGSGNGSGGGDGSGLDAQLPQTGDTLTVLTVLLLVALAGGLAYVARRKYRHI